jgi:hypothetical protein
VKIRFVCASAAAVFGFACSSNTFAKGAYAPATVVYFPPRPAYYYIPPPAYIVPVIAPVIIPVPVADAVTDERWRGGQVT